MITRVRRAGAASSLVAAIAVGATATGFSGVIEGASWAGHIVFAVVIVAVVGVLLRSFRLPPYVVAVCQCLAILGAVTVVGSSNGILEILPGPDAWRDLFERIDEGFQQIDEGVAPVDDTAQLRLMLLLSVGAIAILVDTLVVAASAPAAAGLALLCVYAVPAALADDLLPWPSLVAATAGFALLLTVDSRRRHLAWGRPASSTSLAAVPAAITSAGIALLAGLLVGTTITAVGTEGSLAGSGSKGRSSIGLNPFTSLRGQLENREPVDLFEVTGLEQRTYLRALTLSTFDSDKGWEAAPFDGTRNAGPQMPLPRGVSTPIPGPEFNIRVETLDYEDVWLPTYGVPLSMTGLTGRWRYDAEALTVFALSRRKAQPYDMRVVIPEPDPAVLRGIRNPAQGVDRKYLATGGVGFLVRQTAIDVTEQETNPLDKAIALRNYFTDGTNGFRYALTTGPATGSDALEDFLIRNKTGYCEQYASAMAIMLRTIGIPSRVAVGFTPGELQGDTRKITTADAHAWVEAWFPGEGWLPFDPTPLADGRAVVPPYVSGEIPASPDLTAVAPPALSQLPLPPDDPEAGAVPDSALDDGQDDGAALGTLVVVLVVAGVLVAFGLLPAVLRRRARRRRLGLVAAGGADAADSAWREILAESADRGARLPAGETLRTTANRLVHAHELDLPGRTGLTEVVGAVERSWYGGQTATDPGLAKQLREVRASLARCAPLGRRARWLPWSVISGWLDGWRPASRSGKR